MACSVGARKGGSDCILNHRISLDLTIRSTLHQSAQASTADAVETALLRFQKARPARAWQRPRPTPDHRLEILSVEICPCVVVDGFVHGPLLDARGAARLCQSLLASQGLVFGGFVAPGLGSIGRLPVKFLESRQAPSIPQEIIPCFLVSLKTRSLLLQPPPRILVDQL